MIIETQDLEKFRGKKIAIVDGCFDPLHYGHLKYFEAARDLGYELFCNVRHDGYLNTAKSRPTILPEEQRVYLLNSLRTVDYVHLCSTSTADVLERLAPAAYIKGADWKDRGLPAQELEICRRNGTQVVYLDTMFDSSTNLTKQFVERYNREANKVNLSQFEELVFSQRHVEAQHYTDDYFMGDWRSGENDYSVERRREVEGKNPQNIKDTFNPSKVLDLGCGPGALMYLLHEIGVETYGIDFSAAAKELAPPEVRDRIHVGSVTDYHDFGVKFDLVICRELLEHLTVLEVRQAISNMARLTEKYVYVTTRFHPNPQSLLDVTDDRLTDPSHITVLNKEMMRVLFVLEGMRQRPDLEAKLDWKNYGRVLVYEKIKA